VFCIHLKCLVLQVVAGFRYRLYFDMRKSNCSKDEYPLLHPDCVHDPEDVVGSVHVKHTHTHTPVGMATPVVESNIYDLLKYCKIREIR